jgi:hypothetical protein
MSNTTLAVMECHHACASKSCFGPSVKLASSCPAPGPYPAGLGNVVAPSSLPPVLPCQVPNPR